MMGTKNIFEYEGDDDLANDQGDLTRGVDPHGCFRSIDLSGDLMMLMTMMVVLMILPGVSTHMGAFGSWIFSDDDHEDDANDLANDLTRGVDPHRCFRSVDLVGDGDNVARH